jgi:hypothetical protein
MWDLAAHEAGGIHQWLTMPDETEEAAETGVPMRWNSREACFALSNTYNRINVFILRKSAG